MKKTLFALAAVVMVMGIVCAVYAGEAWKAEFEAVCSQTDSAMELAEGELKELIERCDKLKPLIESADESTKKVYLRRLQKCRDLYVFALESKGK